MHQPRVSIVLRSFNEAWALRGTLDALKAQAYDNWELIAFDSGSTDGSVEMLREAGPARLIQMLPHEYKPGRVLNQGMRLSQGDRVIFLNADATPQGPHWLAPLVEALADPLVAAVYGRQVPRPDCEAAFVRDYAGRFGTDKDQAEAKGPFFSMVSSGLRRDAWRIRGFREDMQYSEDDEYTRWCRDHGFKVAYRPDSVVMHSHNYTPRQAYKRCFGESWALAAVSPEGDRRPTLARSVLLGWTREVARDLAYCAGSGRLHQFPSTARIRWQQRLGRLHGHQAGWQMHRTDHVL